jgi:DNA-binding NarL/FixJ family response regulator
MMPAKGKKRNPRNLTVAIVEDDEKIRDTYVELVGTAKGIRCIGAYESCEAAFDGLPANLPDVLLMDIGLPGISGIEGVKYIKTLFPSVDILMLTVYDDDEKIFQSICAGATGYLLKNAPPGELIKAIKSIRSGAPMTPSIARRVLNMVRHHDIPPSKDFQLTSRELDILEWLVKGLSFQNIASNLYISPHTVHSHIKNIYEKLHVHSKTEAVSKILKSRLLS